MEQWCVACPHATHWLPVGPQIRLLAVWPTGRLLAGQLCTLWLAAAMAGLLARQDLVSSEGQLDAISLCGPHRAPQLLLSGATCISGSQEIVQLVMDPPKRKVRSAEGIANLSFLGVHDKLDDLLSARNGSCT